MNKILVLLSTITALISGPSFAMSGHYGLSSDYMWRGVSQSDGKPAINFSLYGASIIKSLTNADPSK